MATLGPNKGSSGEGYVELHVHVARRLSGEQRAYLDRLLLSQIQVTDGKARVPTETEILIAGLPSHDDLSASKRLRLLIVPWASVPQSTRQTLVDFPQLEIHNLHHNAAATAELAMALLLATAKHIVPVDRALREKDWRACLDPGMNRLLSGLTAVVLGFGAVGRRIALACAGLGLRVVAVRRRATGPSDTLQGITVRSSTDLLDCLPRADVLVIALPLTHETRGMIGMAELELLPPRAILVNVARAEIVNEEALYSALRTDRLAGAGLDVWYQEPTRDELESGARVAVSRFAFHELENIVMSPHRGGALGEERNELRRLDELARLLNAVVRGEPVPNQVDRTLWY